MKNVPKLRFKGFSDEWEEKKLGNLGEFFKGNGISKLDLSEDGNECVLYGQLYTMYNEVIDKVYSKTNIVFKNKVLSQANDVLIPSSGETAIDIATASCIKRDSVLLGGDINVFRANETDGVFLSYQLNNAKRNRLAQLAQGASVVHIYNEQLKKIIVDLPSLQEQQRIANFLTKVDKLIEKQNEKVNNLEDYKKGMMQKIFSQEIRFKGDNGEEFPEWAYSKLNDICTFYSGGTPSTSKKQYYDGTIPFIRSAEIASETTELYISREGLENSSAKMINKGDLLYALYGATSGEVSISKINGAINQAILCIQSNKCNLKFLELLLRFNKDKIIGAYIQGGQGNLSANIIKNLQYKLPCLEEQTKIANFLSKIDNILEKEKEKLEELRKWKKGLLQQMFV